MRFTLRTLLIAATLLPPYFSVLWSVIDHRPRQVQQKRPIIQPGPAPVWSLEIQVVPYAIEGPEESSARGPALDAINLEAEH
jgi:hypothetical protein